MALKVKTKKINGKILAVQAIGRIIGKDDKKFREAIIKAGNNKKCETVIIDLSDVDFIDSTAIGAIMYENTMLSKDNDHPKELVIVNENSYPFNYVKRIIEFFMIEKVITIYDNFNAAVAKISENYTKLEFSLKVIEKMKELDEEKLSTTSLNSETKVFKKQ